MVSVKVPNFSVHVLIEQGGFLHDTNITNVTAFDYFSEPNLDLQYAMTLVYPQHVILYQVRLLDILDPIT